MSALALPFDSTSVITLTRDRDVPWMDSYPNPSVSQLTRPGEGLNVVQIKSNRIRVTSSGAPSPEWLEPTIRAFDTVQNLSTNWDSYGGEAIRQDLIKQSLRVIAFIMEWRSPAPSIVPLGDGGIQVEWHRNQQDLEMVFPAEESPQFYYINRKTGMDQEGPVNAEKYAALTQLLRNLT